MRRFLVSLTLAVLCGAAFVRAGDWGDWGDFDSSDPLGNPDWWEGGDHPPYGGPGSKLPPWLWFFINGKQGLDGRDGRKGDMGEKGDCGDPGEIGPSIKGYKGMMGEMGDPGDDGMPGEPGDQGEQGEPGPPGQNAMGEAAPIAKVYTRWGSDTCRPGAELFYSGRAATSYHNNAGAGANIVCITDPISIENTFSWFTPFDQSFTTVYGTIVGIEYDFTVGDPLFDAVHGHNVPCAVCGVEVNTVHMFPGRTMCPVGWALEYAGYLMSEKEGVTSGGRASENYRSSYVCVDINPDSVPGLNNPNQEASLTHVAAVCPPGGILPCTGEKYDWGQIFCVVCSKPAP